MPPSLLSRIFRQTLSRFVLVGIVAAAVHFCVVVLLVNLLGWWPLLANVVAFLVAFNVSYSGHRFWTFYDTTLMHRQSLPRFFFVAVSSFLLNETMYALLLIYTPIPYWLSLLLVLVAVAVITFSASRLWVFARN